MADDRCLQGIEFLMSNKITKPQELWLSRRTERINLDKTFLRNSVVFGVKRCPENDTRTYYVKRGGGRCGAAASSQTQGDGGTSEETTRTRK